MCHTVFFRRISQNKKLIENFCKDLKNLFHLVFRKWYLDNQTLEDCRYF